MERREFLKAFGLTSAAILFGSPLRLAQAATAGVALSGLATGFGAQALDFDGTNDYLSRATDLVGNVDGKTFTLSAWLWLDDLNTTVLYGSDNGFQVTITTATPTTFLQIIGRNAADTTNLNLAIEVPQKSWFHLLVSVDLMIASNRHVYINDGLLPGAAITWNTYNNDNIDFTNTTHRFARDATSTFAKCRISNVYLDYTYRNLSIEANRRKFITVDRKPVTMTPSSSGFTYANKSANVNAQETIPHAVTFSNDGTKMYVSGQTYSDVFQYTLSTPWDVSTAVYASKSLNLTPQGGFPFGLSLSSDGTKLYSLQNGVSTVFQYTLGTAWDVSTGSYANKSLAIGAQSSNPHGLCFSADGTKMYVSSSSPTVAVYQYALGTPWDVSTASYLATTGALGIGLADDVCISADGTKMYVASSYTIQIFEYTLGTAWNVSTTSLTNAVRLEMGGDYNPRGLFVSSTNAYVIGTDNDNVYQYTLGPSGSVAAPVNPILYLPMTTPGTAYINNGTGGNFTLNGVVAESGRGPIQFNAAYSDLDGSADYLSRTSITGIADGKAATYSATFNLDVIDATYGAYLIFFGPDTSTRTFSVHIDPTGYIRITCEGVAIFASASSGIVKVGRNYTIIVSFDTSDTNKRHVYLNGQSVAGTWTTYTNTNLDLTTANYWVGRVATAYVNCRMGNVFFHNSYIDLSVPANLAKFVSGTGIDAKPVSLGANGELPLGSSPLIY